MTLGSAACHAPEMEPNPEMNGQAGVSPRRLSQQGYYP